MYKAPMVALVPAIAIVLTVIALNMLTDGIQMYMDPGQRKLPSIKRFLRKEAEKA